VDCDVRDVKESKYRGREWLMKTVLASFAVVGLLIGGPGLAADLPVRGFPIPPPLLFTWTACYAGFSGGGGWGHKESADPSAIITLAASVPLVTIDPTGWLVGAQAGCDYQFSPNWVAGIGATFSGGSIKGHSAFPIPSGSPGDLATVTARIDAIATITGRLGWAFGRYLLYAKGGLAWEDEQFSAVGTFRGLGSPFDLEGPSLRLGWTVGAGFEWAFSDFWSLRIDYDFYDFGNGGVTFTDTLSPSTGSLAIKQTVQTFKVGLSFRMMAEPVPVVPVVGRY
jgi:outer membrane immunogenic protein